MIFSLIILNIFSFQINAAQLTVKKTTWLKKSTAQASSLSNAEKCLLPKGKVYEVEVTGQREGHSLLAFQSLDSCSFTKGYVFNQHVAFKGLNEVRLSIPHYFYQWHNRYLPASTCGMTSAAMLLSYHLKKRITPDEIFRRYGTHRPGQSPEGLAQIYRDYGVRASHTRFGSFDKIKAHLNNGEPVVVHGYFTAGHIVLISGYTQQGFVVQDPAGNWNRRNYGGYPDAPHDPTGGKDVIYTYSQMRNAIIEPSDGSLWVSWIVL